MEKQVYRWAKDELDRGQRVQMVDLCKFAKHISRNKYFMGSTGWCANFLNRHPDLKNIIKLRKYEKLDKTIEKYYYMGDGMPSDLSTHGYPRPPNQPTSPLLRSNFMTLTN
jgi:hypothetical protein